MPLKEIKMEYKKVTYSQSLTKQYENEIQMSVILSNVLTYLHLSAIPTL